MSALVQPARRERGVVLTGPEVHAFQRWKKSQMRFPLALPVHAEHPIESWRTDGHGSWYGVSREATSAGLGVPETDLFCCPHGDVGDRLWVRETWSPDAKTVYPFDSYLYRADFGVTDDPARGEHAPCCKGNDGDCLGCLKERSGFQWRSSTSMPRKASRLVLEIADVRIERLHAITEADACDKEGVAEWDGLIDELKLYPMAKAMRETTSEGRVWYAVLWEERFGKTAPWHSNPWVWVLTFLPGTRS